MQIQPQNENLISKNLKVLGCVTQKELSLHIFLSWKFSELLFFRVNVFRRTLPYDFVKKDSTIDVF